MNPADIALPAATQRWRTMRRVALTVSGLLLLAYASMLAWLWLTQENLIFLPRPLPTDHRFELPGVEERFIDVPGARINALHFRQPGAKGIVFFLHGNAGNLQRWLPSTDFYQRTKFDVFMIDYRGYGKSSGRIQSEAQLHADVMVAWHSVAGEYADRKKVIYGRSLGSGLAAKLASEVKADLLVLVSPYYSMLRMGREQYPLVPSFVVRYPLPTHEWLPQARMPTMILHGTRDTLIPVTHAYDLKRIRPDTDLIELPHADHHDIYRDPAYIEALAARITGL